MKFFRKWGPNSEQFNHAAAAIQAHALTGLKSCHGMADADNCGNAIFPSDDRAMGQRTTNFQNQSTSVDKERGPAGIGEFG